MTRPKRFRLKPKWYNPNKPYKREHVGPEYKGGKTKHKVKPKREIIQ